MKCIFMLTRNVLFRNLISISMEHYLIKAISSIGAKLNLRRRHM